MRRPLITLALAFLLLLHGNALAQPGPPEAASEVDGRTEEPADATTPQTDAGRQADAGQKADAGQQADAGPPAEPEPPPTPQAPPLPALTPPASPPQVFTLKNGSTIQGWVVVSRPGQELIILTQDGWQLSIPWQQVGPPEAATQPIGVAPGRAGPDRGRIDNVPPPDDAAPTGIRLGARLGLAFPFGSAKRDTDLSDGFGMGVPLVLELGGQTDSIYFGAYAGYQVNSAGKQISDACEAADCSLYGIRLGFTIEARFANTGEQYPWASYSLGFSGDEVDVEENGVTRQQAWGGIDFATILAGLDFRLGDRLLAGPFAGVSLSYYLYEVDAIDGRGETDAINHGALHGWAQLGVRAAVLP